jgi:peptidoglycan hydrolase-like protein with peptidoglycan-binding domain
VIAVIKCLLLIIAVLTSGLSAAQVAVPAHRQVVDIAFPTVPHAEFRDDYDHGRGTGRAHRATDLFAQPAAPVQAAVGGTVSWLPSRHHPTAGYAVHVRGDDGRLYAYYHLGSERGGPQRAYAPGLRQGARVERGQLIGYVGDSGNAVGGRAHLHFEIHDDTVRDPYGTNRLNPYPSLLAALRQGAGDRAARGDGRTTVLRLGDRGPAVGEWQQVLNATGAAIGVDGVFGPQTDRATRDLQRARGITADGIVGPQTRAVAASVPAVAAAAVVTPLPASTLLRLGDRSPAVTEWQRRLNQTGARIAVDGIFGPQTDRATRAFQQTRGLAVDGVVGPQTRAAMGG